MHRRPIASRAACFREIAGSNIQVLSIFILCLCHIRYSRHTQHKRRFIFIYRARLILLSNGDKAYCPTLSLSFPSDKHSRAASIAWHTFCTWAFSIYKGTPQAQTTFSWQKISLGAHVSERDSKPASHITHLRSHHYTMFLFVSTLQIAIKKSIRHPFYIRSRFDFTLSIFSKHPLCYPISFSLSQHRLPGPPPAKSATAPLPQPLPVIRSP